MQFDQFGRREFIPLIGGVVAKWPLAAHTQQHAIPGIGFLHLTSREKPRARSFIVTFE